MFHWFVVNENAVSPQGCIFILPGSKALNNLQIVAASIALAKLVWFVIEEFCYLSKNTYIYPEIKIRQYGQSTA